MARKEELVPELCALDTPEALCSETDRSRVICNSHQEDSDVHTNLQGPGGGAVGEGILVPFADPSRSTWRSHQTEIGLRNPVERDRGQAEREGRIERQKDRNANESSCQTTLVGQNRAFRMLPLPCVSPWLSIHSGDEDGRRSLFPWCTEDGRRSLFPPCTEAGRRSLFPPVY